MTSRERFLATMRFQPVDRPIYWPGGPRQSTLERWRKEGLPEDTSPAQLLGLDPSEGMPLNLGPLPRFEAKVIEDRGRYKIWMDELGAKRLDFTVDETPGFVTRTWLEFPVTDRASFREMQQRFNPDDPARYPEDWEARVERWRQRECPLSLTMPSLFWRVRDWVGFETICTLIYDDPALLHEMMDFWADFVVRAIRRAVGETEIDYVILNEDMCYKTASMISPAHVREFMFPGYRRIVECLRGGGIEFIFMDSDGYTGELVPLWLQVGINGLNPIEIAAGNDPVAYRKQYPRELLMLGGIDKRELRTTKQAVEREFAKVPWLVAQGGYIPCVDHGIPPDVPWENYVHLVELIKGIRLDQGA